MCIHDKSTQSGGFSPSHKTTSTGFFHPSYTIHLSQNRPFPSGTQPPSPPAGPLTEPLQELSHVRRAGVGVLHHHPDQAGHCEQRLAEPRQLGHLLHAPVRGRHHVQRRPLLRAGQLTPLLPARRPPARQGRGGWLAGCGLITMGRTKCSARKPTMGD